MEDTAEVVRYLNDQIHFELLQALHIILHLNFKNCYLIIIFLLAILHTLHLITFHTVLYHHFLAFIQCYLIEFVHLKQLFINYNPTT